MPTITFNRLRQIKASLPQGSIQRIADALQLNPDTVRNYFGGDNYKDGAVIGFHHEPGPDGGICQLDRTDILDMALDILGEQTP